MLKLSNILFIVCSCLVTKTTIGFQQARFRASRCWTAPEAPFPRLRRQQQQQRPFWMIQKNKKEESSRLYAFGGGGGFGNGGFNFNINPPNPPIKTKKDVLKRVVQIVSQTLRQFYNGLMTGYIMGTGWGLLRPPTGVNRGLVWGLDFGVLSAIFSGTDKVTQFVLMDLFKPKETEKDIQKRQQTTSLWSVTLRNMILALYFKRHGGLAVMAKFAAIYGGLTYYFVHQKQKRDALRPPITNTMFGGSPNMGGMGGMGNMGGMGGNMGGMGGQQPPSAAMMQQLMQQFMANQQGAMGTPPPKTQSSAAPSSTKSTPPPKKREEPPKGDILDVEFEKVENNDDEDA